MDLRVVLSHVWATLPETGNTISNQQKSGWWLSVEVWRLAVLCCRPGCPPCCLVAVGLNPNVHPADLQFEPCRLSQAVTRFYGDESKLVSLAVFIVSNWSSYYWELGATKRAAQGGELQVCAVFPLSHLKCFFHGCINGRVDRWDLPSPLVSLSGFPGGDERVTETTLKWGRLIKCSLKCGRLGSVSAGSSVRRPADMFLWECEEKFVAVTTNVDLCAVLKVIFCPEVRQVHPMCLCSQRTDSFQAATVLIIHLLHFKRWTGQRVSPLKSDLRAVSTDKPHRGAHRSRG